MLLFKEYKIFLRIFFVMGLAPLLTTSELNENRKRRTRFTIKSILTRLLPLINFLVSLSQCSFLLKIADGTFDGQVHVILFYGYFFLTILSNSVGNVQCFFYQSEYFHIINSIHQIERLFVVKFFKQIDYQRPCTIFKRKTLLTYLTLISVTLTSYFVNGWQLSKENLLRTVITILETICTLNSLHPMLFIDITKMFIFEMNVALKSSKKFFQSTVLGRCDNWRNLN